MNDGYFGVCPICRKNDGYINVGRGHWFLCDEHKIKWLAGSNLFDSSKEQTEEEQRQIYDARGVGDYKEVSLSDVAEKTSEQKTYRDLLKKLLIETIHEAVGGSPWVDWFGNDVDSFVTKVMAAVDATPSVAEELNKPVRQSLCYLPDTVNDYLRDEPLPF